MTLINPEVGLLGSNLRCALHPEDLANLFKKNIDIKTLESALKFRVGRVTVNTYIFLGLIEKLMLLLSVYTTSSPRSGVAVTKRI